MAQQFHWKDYVTNKNQNFYLSDLFLQPGEKLLTHCHDYYEFFIVLQGNFIEYCNGKEAPLSRRQGHILQPADVHYLRNPSEKCSVLRNIAIARPAFVSLLETAGLEIKEERLHGYFSLEESEYGVFCRKTEAFAALLQNQKGREFLLQNVCEDVLLSVLIPNTAGDVPKWLLQLCKEMEQEDNLCLGLARMRQLSGRSPEYLNRSFQKYYGQTPTAFINRLRLQYAARLLQGEHGTISQIAYDCGFENISYFNRLFKLQYGKTPKAYREQKKFFFRSI